MSWGIKITKSSRESIFSPPLCLCFLFLKSGWGRLQGVGASGAVIILLPQSVRWSLQPNCAHIAHRFGYSEFICNFCNEGAMCRRAAEALKRIARSGLCPAGRHARIHVCMFTLGLYVRLGFEGYGIVCTRLFSPRFGSGLINHSDTQGYDTDKVLHAYGFGAQAPGFPRFILGYWFFHSVIVDTH